MWSDFELLAIGAAEAAHHLERPGLMARMLGLQGALACRRGLADEGRRHWEHRLNLCESLGDRRGCVDALFDLAAQAFQARNGPAAKTLLTRALAIARSLRSPDMLATARAIQAEAAAAQGDEAMARKRALQAQGLAQIGTDRDLHLYVYRTLGRVHRALGDPDSAEIALRTMLQSASEGERTLHICEALLELGVLYEEKRWLQHAATAYVGACNMLDHISPAMQRQARQALARLESVYRTDPVRLFIEKARQSSWRDSVRQLLEERLQDSSP